MKKLLTICILLTYFAVSSGFVVSMHYCMDRFDSVEFGRSHSDKCGKCGMEKDSGCCKEEVMMIKLETSHIPAQVMAPDFSVEAPHVVETTFLLSPLENYTVEQRPVSHGPPLNKQYSYISNCVFRI